MKLICFPHCFLLLYRTQVKNQTGSGEFLQKFCLPCIRPYRSVSIRIGLYQFCPTSPTGSTGPTLTLVCRLPASTLAGTFRRCRRRISGTYRTFETYRTKVDRMANFFSADLLWCGSRPPIQRMKKSFDYASSAGCKAPVSRAAQLRFTCLPLGAAVLRR